MSKKDKGSDKASSKPQTSDELTAAVESTDKADKKAAKKAKKAAKKAAEAAAASFDAPKGASGDPTDKKSKKKSDKSDDKHSSKSDKQAKKSAKQKVKAKKSDAAKGASVAFRDVLRAGEGFELASLDASSTPGWEKGRKSAEKLLKATSAELSDLQERLYASERETGGRSVLLIIQGMDTSGKGGIMRHVVGELDPQGVMLTSFKAPTKEEKQHPFLWRIRNALPKPGYVGVFDRSQYEDVLIVRVHDLVSRSVWMRRYGQINAFEESTAAKGTTIIKVMLHIDADEQKARLMERLDNSEKHYKFNPGDLVERKYWDEYQAAYQAVLERTSTDTAPWYVVPANNKWYARLAVQQLLLEHLRDLNLTWPAADFDVDEQKAILAGE